MNRGITAALVTIAIILFLACGGGGSVSTRLTETPSPVSEQPTETPNPQAEPEQPAKSVAAAAYMVRVEVHDDTKNIPLHQKAEVWFRGRGSWWIKDATKFGSAAENLAEREPDKQDTIHIYPDGRDGKEIIASLMMTAEMNPIGSVRDAVRIVITDDEVTVYGLPIKAATGEFEYKFKRYTKVAKDNAKELESIATEFKKLYDGIGSARSLYHGPKGFDVDRHAENQKKWIKYVRDYKNSVGDLRTRLDAIPQIHRPFGLGVAGGSLAQMVNAVVFERHGDWDRLRNDFQTDMAEAEQEIKAMRKRLGVEGETAEKPEEEFRIWTSTTNTTVEARFGGLIGEKIILEKRDGERIKVPLNKLSDADQEFIAAKR